MEHKEHGQNDLLNMQAHNRTPFLMAKNNQTVFLCLARQAWVDLRDKTQTSLNSTTKPISHLQK